MTTRPKKLTKAAVKQFGVFSKIDAEISTLLNDFKTAGDSIYWKKSELLKLKAKCITIERELAQLQNQRAELLETLDKLFFAKKNNAPNLESIDRALNEIVKFRQTVANINDDGDIVKE